MKPSMKPSARDNLKHWFRSHRGRLRRWLALAGLAGAFAPGVSGCLAASLAPLALQGVELVGSAIGGSTKAGAMMAHDKDPNPDEQEATADFDEDFNDPALKTTKTESRCNELILVSPMIAQFRAASGGALEWRELGLAGSPDAPLWGVRAEKDGPAAGWRPATNLSRMHFTPPLRLFPYGGDGGNGTFIAYAPAQTQNEAERDELAALAADFGAPAGTFDFNGRTYSYDEMASLPCFPVPH